MKSIPAKTVLRTLLRLASGLPGATLLALMGAAPARAHAFGTRYDLPLPLELYLAGAAVAVALSFVIMAIFFRVRPAPGNEPETDLLDFRALRALLHPALIAAVQVVSVGLFVLVLAAGWFGNQDTVKNLAPLFVWVIWWVGLAYLTCLVGNVWPVINPWSIMFTALERLYRLFGGRGRLGLGLAYPSWLGAWPAIAFFGLFAWFELISEEAKRPAALATVILVYSALTWLGMAAFGRKAWLANGEAFSLAFGVFGRFAPVGAPVRDGLNGRPRHWYLRSYASALVVSRPCRLLMTVFVLLMLSTVTFDGFKETPLWEAILRRVALEPALHPLIRALHDFGFDFNVVLESMALALFPVLFLAVYLGFCWLIRWAAGSGRPVTEIAGLFVLSLVPIAIAYHLAHYLSYLLLAGQLVIPLASDPFGVGWDVFGTAGYRIDIGIIGAKFVWYTAVIAIVVGHVFAIGVAHFVALRVFGSARAALASQYPMLVLMVAYTVVSLWILSQPIVGRPNLNQLDAPSDTLTLAPFEYAELCLKLAKQERIQYTFEAVDPVEFDIHYHDGFVVRFPFKLTGRSVPAGRFVAEEDRSFCLMWFNPSLTKISLTYRVERP